MICRTCRHCDAKTYAVPICVKAANPQACVLAFERCDGRYWEARK